MNNNSTKKQVPVTERARITTEIVDLTSEGMGVAKVDGFPIFVHNALPGERVTIKVTKVLKNFAVGKVEAYEVTSPDRVEPLDHTGFASGTMALQHLSYPAQLAFKTKRIKEAMERIGEIKTEIRPTLEAPKQTGYRNKAQIPVQYIDGELKTGIYKAKSHELIPVDQFYIQHPAIDEAILTIRELLNKYNESHKGAKIEAYDEKTHRGALRHIIVRYSERSKEMMIIFVVKSSQAKIFSQLLGPITKQLPEVVSIVENINGDKTNRIVGRKNYILWGKDTYREELLGFQYDISPLSFFQVNTDQAETLYQQAIDAAQLTGKERVLDLYCGLGSLTLPLAQKAKRVYGIEVIPEAVKQAEHNAELNGVKNVIFQAGKTEDVLPQWIESGIKPDVIVVDPPRKGLDERVRQTMIEASPERIVYVSCHPGSLARDLKDFVAGGYEVKYVQGVDLFVMTPHVETIALLQKVKS
ncbi:23S rRNA (uracil(1939)-C(5))-methyltransferase RlmD [Atopobacter phocae]|uniref:23S rRNA (uracil(1939)-C(5))-methyltransferase RlmD n=1 Tax=Atopobacter phocae TaxID=136492 RepID=UPI0004703FC9|nr:23S rRNA (uracil(1939)-C(5))-methyltransferase RlmD [Atopobacter phocae]